MNLFVHLMIGHSVRKTLIAQKNVKFNYIYFLYGNILPDISAAAGRSPHFLKDSLDFVLDSAAEINSSGGGTEGKPCDLAVRAGILSHYLSDFFCYAHSEWYQKGMSRHHLYEFLLLFEFRKGLSFYKKQSRAPGLSLTEMRGYILEQSRAYQRERHFLFLDIRYALTVSSAVLLGLFEKADEGRPFLFCSGRSGFNESGVLL